MNGYRKWGSSALGAVVAAALALGACLLLAPVGCGTGRARAGVHARVHRSCSRACRRRRWAASPSSATRTWCCSNGSIVPGVLAPARVALDVEVCDSAGSCFDPTAITGPVPFAAGTGTLAITAELMTPAENGETGSITGRLSFTAPDDALAATGSEWAPWISAGLAAVAVGALVLALVRSRRGTGDASAHSPR